MTTQSLDAPDLDDQLEDLERVKQEALGQRDAVQDHTADTVNALSNLRLCAEQLAAAYEHAMVRLDTIPAFSAELPDEQDGKYGDLNLSKTARTLLGTFNRDALADLEAGIDSAVGAVRRYRDRADVDYERLYGEPVGWRSFYKQIGAAPAILDDKCPVKDCGRETHDFVRVTDDGLTHLRDGAERE